MFYATARPFFVRRAAFLQDPLAAACAVGIARRPAARGTDLSEDDSSYTLRFDTPGVTREQLSIGIEGQVLRIESVADAPRRYAFALELPTDIDVAGSQARLEHGVLTLRLAKQPPASRAQSIQIN